MAKDQTTTNSDRLIFDEVKERLRDQFESIDSIDTKAGIVLGFDGAILAALLNSEWFRGLPIYFLVPILLLICLVTGIALKAFLIKGYRKDPEPSQLIKGYQGKMEKETLGQLIRNFEESFNDNSEPIEEKKKYLNWSFKLLALAVVVMAFVAFLSSISDNLTSYTSWKIHRQEVIRHGRFR
ncbi:MAG: hypothetical protein COU70_02055 [Parcubacteria group bacterium CG10_big_fil_rev_8_21_14_0_10_35_15]|nr:MAG: hypothetical protein COU70_02055 [Parcubacteria group bacterium CG10_big_fil_rev_8_21_14_0_10_35_15]